jgi:hypothetical protein
MCDDGPLLSPAVFDESGYFVLYATPLGIKGMIARSGRRGSTSIGLHCIALPAGLV